MWGWTCRWLATAMGIAAFAGVLVDLDAISFVQRPTSDALLRIAAASPPRPPPDAPDVAVVAIDGQSLRAFGREWPWPRSRFAELVRRLDDAGARAIALDVDLSTPGSSSGDRKLARAVARSGRVVLSAHREVEEAPGEGVREVAHLPVPELQRAAARVGAALVEIDPDGVIRNAFRWRSIADEEVPALCEAALSVAFGEAPEIPSPAPFPIDYRRAEPRVPVIPVIDVLRGRFDPAQLIGRVVLVGVTAAEFRDVWRTPLAPDQPGVVIQALAVRTLAAQRAGDGVLSVPGKGAQLALLTLLSILAAAIGSTSPRRRALGYGMLGAGVPLASLGALWIWGVLLDPILPLAVVGLHSALALDVVRRRLNPRPAERELSLSARFNEKAEATGSDGLELSLALLGDVVNASGVALLRTNSNGELDGDRFEWRRRSGRAVGDVGAATLVLADRQTRIFEGVIPGRDDRRGLAVYAPLFGAEHAVGVLVVEQEFARQLSDMELRMIATVGTQLAVSVENLRLYHELQATFRSSLAALVSAIEARDGYTDVHCRRLAAFSVLMAERLGLSREETEAIELGALLRDVGKLGIRDEVLLKGEGLTPEERIEIEQHTLVGHRIVRSISGISPTTVGCVRYHHERWNGTGYPDGLAGEEIPLGARIVALLDVWDALSTNRPYKHGYTQPRVKEILQKDSGVRFEPTLVEIFLEILEERGPELLDLIGSGSEPMW